MRNRDDYLSEGRNDPLSPEQLREHPYDFVSLPSRPRQEAEVVPHDRYSDQLLSGTLTLVYTTTSPLHVGSGVFEQAADCGLEGGSMPVRGIVRSRGRPVLPGSGWKGAVRSRFEAITRSRLAVVGTFGREPAFKVPDVLRSREAHHRVSISDRRVTDDLKPLGVLRRDHLDIAPDRVTVKGHRDQLSPAESLFGCMGYRGRVHPNDGIIEGPAATAPLQVAPLDSPVMHRLAMPGKLNKSGSGSLTISQVEGRKQYYDGDVVSERQIEGRNREGAPSEYVDHVPAGCTLTIEIHVESLSLAEFGALLVSAGYSSDTGIVRFGGYKPVGLGRVELQSATSQLWPGIATRSWRRPEPEKVDLDQAVAEAQQQDLIDQQALAELHAVTTRRRP
jgi:CRISPR/Cas system CSM-associated protein Csm3 (group 7 of RAMP superfamily)